MKMFSDELLQRAKCQPAKPRWLERMVSWWRRITGRDRYHMGTDPGNGDRSAWCLCRHDTKTGVITANDQAQRPGDTAMKPTTNDAPEPGSLHRIVSVRLESTIPLSCLPGLLRELADEAEAKGCCWRKGNGMGVSIEWSVSEHAND